MQRQWHRAWNSATAKLRSSVPGASVNASGLIRFAKAGADSAEREISTIGVGSMLGILLLLILVFRSLRPLLLSLLSLSIGGLAAFSVTALLFS